MGQQSIRVLLVDDDPGDADLTRRALSEIDAPSFLIDVAASMSEAVGRVTGGKYDVVLLDLGLPDSPSHETLSRFREVCRDDVPIIVLTGLVDERVAAESVDCGAQDYITKDDITPSLLRRTVRYALLRQHLLHQVRAANELLEEKNHRLAQLYDTAQQFVENVSHEFRTPLTVIREFASIIRDGIDGPVTAKQREHLTKLLHRTDDLSLMVDDMLDVSRLEAGLLGVWRRRCQPNDLVENVIGMLKGRAESKRITLTTELPPDLPAVYCDEEKAHRVIMNLTVNAIKFAPESATVHVWARRCEGSPDVEIGVRDNGLGISSENLKIIFDRFRQVEQGPTASTKGFGLGLNIAKELVALNLGQISVQSSLGQGSTFSFTLPPFRTEIVFARYLTHLASAAHARSDISLFSVDVDATEMNQSVMIDEFLQRSVRSTDLVMSERNYRWVIAAPCAEADCERLIQRLTSEWNSFVRNSPHSVFVPLRIEYRGSWSLAEEREDLSAAFVELCQLKEPKPTPKVLVVDDDPEVTNCLVLRLQGAGYQVISATNGADGLDVARAEKPDAIVLDVRMPKKDGLTVLRELRTEEGMNQLPVIMLSASIRDQQLALQAGASYFVRKPYEPNEVLSAIESSIGRGVS